MKRNMLLLRCLLLVGLCFSGCGLSSTPSTMVDFTPNGKTIVAACIDGFVRAEAVSEGGLACEIDTKAGRVVSLAVIDDNRAVAANADKHSFSVYDLKSKKATSELRTDGAPVCGLFHLSGDEVLVFDRKGKLERWDVGKKDGALASATLPAKPTAAAISKDAATVAVSVKKSVRIYDSHTLALLEEIAFASPLRSVGFVEGTRLLAVLVGKKLFVYDREKRNKKLVRKHDDNRWMTASRTLPVVMTSVDKNLHFHIGDPRVGKFTYTYCTIPSPVMGLMSKDGKHWAVSSGRGVKWGKVSHFVQSEAAKVPKQNLKVKTGLRLLVEPVGTKVVIQGGSGFKACDKEQVVDLAAGEVKLSFSHPGCTKEERILLLREGQKRLLRVRLREKDLKEVTLKRHQKVGGVVDFLSKDEPKGIHSMGFPSLHLGPGGHNDKFRSAISAIGTPLVSITTVEGTSIYEMVLLYASIQMSASKQKTSYIGNALVHPQIAPNRSKRTEVPLAIASYRVFQALAAFPKGDLIEIVNVPMVGRGKRELPDDKVLSTISLDKVKYPLDKLHRSCFSPRGHSFASISSTGWMALCSSIKGKLLFEVKHKFHKAMDLAFSYRGDELIVTDGKKIWVYDANSGKSLYLAEGKFPAAISHDSALVCHQTPLGDLKIVNLQSGLRKAIIYKGKKRFYALAFDKKDEKLVTMTRDSAFQIFDTSNWEHTWTVRASRQYACAPAYLSDSMYAIWADESPGRPDITFCEALSDAERLAFERTIKRRSRAYVVMSVKGVNK